MCFTDGKTELPDLEEILSAAYPNLVDFHTVPLYPNIAEAFGAKESFMLLLRPDNYIGLEAAEVSLEKAAAYIEQGAGSRSDGDSAVLEAGKTCF